jgi:hypothetical protein
MKYIKMLGLAAVAAAALMALIGVGSASATVLCTETPAAGKHCPTNTTLGPAKEDDGDVLDASIETSALLKTSGGTTIATCAEGTVKGTITVAGNTTTTTSGDIEELTWAKCSTTVKTLANGTLEVHHIAGTDNGTVTSSGTEVTINFIGLSCIFKTSNTDIGVLTGSGTMATFDIEGTITGTSGGFCPASGIWSGAYTVTTPSGSLFVAAG